MKKVYTCKLPTVILMIMFILIMTAGCGKSNKPSSNTINGNNNKLDVSGTQVNGKTVGVKGDAKFPETPQITQGTKVIVYTSEGDSEGGTTPVMKVSEENVLIGIDIVLKNFDKDKDTYIFIDKKCIDVLKDVGEERQAIYLVHEFLTDGDKTIQAVQFENNDTSKKVVKYNEVKFTIEHGKSIKPNK